MAASDWLNNSIEVYVERKAIYTEPLNIIEKDRILFDKVRILPKVNIKKHKFILVDGKLHLIKFNKIIGTNITEDYHNIVGQRIPLFNFRLIRKFFFGYYPFFLIADTLSGNYFHFLFDVLPKLLVIDKLGIRVKLILPNNFPSNFLVFLKSLGYDEFVFLKSWNLFFFRSLYYIDHVFSPSGVFHRDQVKELYEWLTAKGKINIPIKHSEPLRIYLSRNSANSRRIVNENELKMLVSHFGFISISTDDMEIEEQLRLFSNCSILISPHGAGLANMIAMPPNSCVVEIRQKVEFPNNIYMRLASEKLIRYYYIHSENKDGDFQADDLVIDINCVSELLLTIIPRDK